MQLFDRLAVTVETRSSSSVSPGANFLSDGAFRSGPLLVRLSARLLVRIASPAVPENAFYRTGFNDRERTRTKQRFRRLNHLRFLAGAEWPK